MNKKLKILHLEDIQSDVELIRRLLKKGNIDCEYLVVDAKEAYIIALQEFNPDVVLSDHTLPSFDSHEALAILQDTGLKIPFILVTATVSEEFAVDVIKRGAEDYILKDRPERLPSAIRNALGKFSRKKELEQMIYDQSHLAAIVNSSNDCIISEKLDGTITSWNLSAEKFFGYSATEVIGKNISLIIPQDRLQKEAEIMESIKKGAPAQHLETVRLTRTAARVDVSITISPLNDTIGKLIGATTVVYDITERKKVEQQLADSEKFSQEILASLTSHIAVLDESGMIITVNKAWDDFARENAGSSLGITSKGINYFDVCKKAIEAGDSIAAQTLAGIQSVFKKDKEIFQLEYPCHATDRKQWFTLRVMNFGSESSKVVISHENITARKMAEEKTIHVNRLYAFISQINQTILQAKEEQALFNQVCRIAVEQGKFKMAWIGIADTAKRKINLVANSGLSDREIEMFTDYTYDIGGPIEKTLSGLEYYVANDLQKEPGIRLSKYAVAQGIHSGIALALKRSGKVIGTFNIYSSEISFFDAAEIVLLKEATADISFALDIFEKEKLKKEADKNLARSELLLKQAQAIAHIGSWTRNLKTDIAEWSQEALAIYGIRKEDSRHSTEYWFSFIHPDDLEYVKQKTSEANATQIGTDFFTRIVRRDGTVRHLHVKTQFEFDNNGESIALQGVLHDVTETKKAEKALQESESNMQAIFENTSEGFVLADSNGVIKFFNNRSRDRIWLNTQQEIHIGDSIFDFIHGSRKDLYKDAISRVLAGEALQYDYPYTRENAKTKWFNFTVNPVYSGNHITGLSITSTNITERKNAEEMIRVSQSNLQAIIENTDAYIYSLDTDFNYVIFNSGLKNAMKENYGIDLKSGYNTFDFISHFTPDDEQEWKEAYSKALNGETIKFEKEFVANDHHTYTSFSIHPIWENKNVIGLSCFVNNVTKEKQNALEKKNLKRLLNKTNRLAAIGSWEIDVDKGTVFWSDITKEIREVDKDFIPQLDMGISYFKENSHEEIISQKVKDCIEKGTPWDEELQIMTFKGNHKWVRTIGEGEFLNGKCKRVYGSFQDIDARKLAEIAAIKISKEKNTILESIGDGFFAVDTNWVVTYWNNHSEKMLHRSAAEMIGRNLWEVYSHNIDSLFYVNFKKAIKENLVQHFESYSEKLKTWYELSAYPSVSGLSVYFHDITERKLAEQQIKADKNLLRTLIDNLPDTIFYKDKSAKKLISNKFDYYSILGADTEQEVLGKTDLELSAHPHALMTYAQDMEILSTGVPLINFEECFTTPDNQPLWLVTSKLPLRNEDNEIIGLLGIGRDITQRKVAEEKLLQLNKALEKNIKQLEISNTELEQFAYVASHDLQEPLRMITSFLTLLEKRYSDQLDDKGKQYIDFAVDGGKRMRQIILDLLEFSRVGRTEDKLEKVDLNEIINEILSLQSQQIKDVKAQVRMDILPVLNSYKSPLRQVFQNLINNSLKYHKDDVAPLIAISVTDDDTFWRFAITDNGIGIESADLNKIFVIFQRLHNKEKYTGTGIGLAITKKIIESLGGKIWVESEEGTGSTFYFTIKK